MQGFALSTQKKVFKPHPIRTRIGQRTWPESRTHRGIRHSPGGTVHVLVTADTMSGSWTYSRELVTGLVTRGVRVTLVSFGEIPLPDQTAWMDLLLSLIHI